MNEDKKDEDPKEEMPAEELQQGLLPHQKMRSRETILEEFKKATRNIPYPEGPMPPEDTDDMEEEEKAKYKEALKEHGTVLDNYNAASKGQQEDTMDLVAEVMLDIREMLAFLCKRNEPLWRGEPPPVV